MKQREQDHSKVLLQKQQQELEHMRLRYRKTTDNFKFYPFCLCRYLAAEENEIMKGDHKQLESIKNELNK